MTAADVSTPPRARSRVLAAVVAVVLVVMTGVRLALLHLPAGRDEAGFLLVADGWGRGEALYGSYWVDRPPLLIWIMQLAGDVTTVRLLGLASCVLMVLGVARTAWLARGPHAAAWAAAAAGLFSIAPWFGVARTNGEMLAVGFVACSWALAAQALLRPGRRSAWWGAAAGAAAAGACLVKQTIGDGVVFAVVLALVIAWTEPATRRRCAGVVGAGAAGFGAAVGVALVVSAQAGTTPAELFDALVVFRAEAGEVIRTSSTGATTDRLSVLVATWAVSGLAVISALSWLHALRRREPVLVATAAVLAVVTGSAVLGGSYWGHYLFQLVPASALAVGLLAGSLRPRVRATAAGLVLVATAANLVHAAVVPASEGREAEVVGTWLRDSGRSTDTAVVAYGQANVLGAARMSSPYPYLWSLPVRVLDPDLSGLAAVLASPQRPTWFVDWSGVASWGIADPRRVTGELGRHYRQVGVLCGRSVWLDREVQRTPAPVPRCP